MDIQIRFYTEDDAWLCFRHATMAALKGDDVKTEVGDYRNANVLHRTCCMKCITEE